MQQHAEVFFHSRFLPPLDCNIIMPVQGNNSYSTDLWAKPGIRFKAVLSKLKKLIKYIYATMQIKHVRVCWDNVQQNFQTTVPARNFTVLIKQLSQNSNLSTHRRPRFRRFRGAFPTSSLKPGWPFAVIDFSVSAAKKHRLWRIQGFSMLRLSACQNLHRFRIFHIPPAWHHPVARSCPSGHGASVAMSELLHPHLRDWPWKDSCPGTGLHDSIFVSIQTLNFCCDGFQNSTQGSSGISDGCQAVKWVWAAQEPTSAFLCPILPSPQHYEWLLCSRSRPGRPIFLRWRCRLSPS